MCNLSKHKYPIASLTALFKYRLTFLLGCCLYLPDISYDIMPDISYDIK